MLPLSHPRVDCKVGNQVLECKATRDGSYTDVFPHFRIGSRSSDLVGHRYMCARCPTKL